MVVHSLFGAVPPPRSDGLAWNRVRVEHGVSEEGPWVEDEVLTLSPLDSDPSKPQGRNLTFKSTVSEAFFRLVFLDPTEGESTPTDPVFDDGSGIAWRATVSDVATLLRARTYVDGGDQQGAFTDQTRPTKGQVQVLLGQAVAEVAARLGAEELPNDDLRSYARELVAIRAAMSVEMSYIPEQADPDESLYEKLKELYDTGIQVLIDALPDSGSTRKGFYSLRVRPDVGGTFSTSELIP